MDETGDPVGRAPDLAEDPPGLEGRDGLFDKGADLRVGPIDCLLTGRKRLPSAAVGNPDRAVCALVALVRPAGDACLGEGIDDAVVTGRAGVVNCTG